MKVIDLSHRFAGFHKLWFFPCAPHPRLCFSPLNFHTTLHCNWTNQPYQLFDCGALPNYNLSGSQDTDECGGITVQSHIQL